MKITNSIVDIKRITFSLLLISLSILSVSSSVLAQDADAILDLGTVTDGVRHVNAAEAAKILEHNGAIKVLDVRTGFEYNASHIEDAVNLNYYSWSFKKSLNELNKNTIWLVHCKTGVRSGKTLPLMKEAGFKNIIHMDGGIDSWKDAGLPVL